MGSQSGLSEDWRAVLLTNAGKIERVARVVCRRSHLSSSEADDFVSHTMLRLMEDDFAILRKFEGRSQLATYLAVVIQRLFSDYRNKNWGKWRPSAQATRGGAMAILLEQLTIRDGFTFEEAVEVIHTNHRSPLSREQLEEVAGTLPSRSRRRFESDDLLEHMVSSAPAPDVIAEDEPRRVAAETASRALTVVLARVPRQDRLILKMRFSEGRTVAQIAVVLGLDPKPLYRRVQRLLSELRSELVDCGVPTDYVHDPSVDVEWRLRWDGEEPRDVRTDSGATA